MDSLILFKADYVVSGWGQKWNGYRQKINAIYDFLLQQDQGEIVCILDAFDSLLIRSPLEMEEEFRKSHKGIIYCKDHEFLYSNPIGKRHREKKWSHASLLLNAGASIGYVSEYRKLFYPIRLKLTRFPKLQVDDQKEICAAYENIRKNTVFGIDGISTFFYLTFPLKRRYPNRNEMPFIISAPGKQDLSPYVEDLRKSFPDFYLNIPMRNRVGCFYGMRDQVFKYFS